jgi:PAS domain S-box-containing protein
MAKANRALLKKPRRGSPAKAAKAGKAPSGSFPIVGVGASAGGLEAFERLLKRLPADTGMAFVLVEHLDPKHESRLTEIFSRVTSMPVSEVKDRMPVEPNHVYIIAPNTSMSLQDSILRLEPRQASETRYMPVDTLFRSLASVQKDKAIGVILSGTASDGAAGMKAIKEEGGITFAQDENSAKHFGMPQSSIAAGAVDFVLSPEQIAKRLTSIGRHPYGKLTAIEQAARAKQSREREAPLDQLFRLLRERYGVDFGNYKASTINRRIQRRMAAKKLGSLRDYLAYVSAHPDEVWELYQGMFVGITGFFREPKSFEALKKLVFPQILKGRSADSPIRIWVPGCSTGEEVYSIAICLLEYLEDKAQTISIEIFGTDINEEAIKKARAGKYSEEIAADVGRDRLRRFFSKIDNKVYGVSKAVRDLCVFSKHDLLSNPPFARMDLLSCRNVLIYLGAPVHQKLVPLFHYALKPSGFLMMGTAETVGGFGDLFTLVDRKHKIYARKAGGKQPFFHFTAPHPAGTAVAEGFRKPPALRTDFERQKEAADLIVLNQYAPASVLVNENMEILHFRGHTGSYLEPAPGAASLNLFKMAREGLLVGLQTAMKVARKKNVPKRSEGVRVQLNGGDRLVNIQVVPLRSPGTKERNFLVLFEDATGKSVAAPEQTRPRRGRSENQGMTQRVAQLKQELAGTKAYLQSVIEDQEAGNEELRSLNEESLSTNEELQSTTEELETSNEELQSANEELTTLNEELHNRNAQLSEAHNDILNLLSSMNMSIVFLDCDSRIRLVTPTAQKILHLASSDVGRPLTDIRLNVEIPDLGPRVLDAIKSAKVKAQEIQDRDGRWFFLQTRPYITGENKVEGAILALTDIHELSERTQELAEANQQLQRELAMRKQAEEEVRGGEERIQLIADSLTQMKVVEEQFRAFVESAPDAMIIVGAKGEIILANQQAEQLFGYTRAEMLGQEHEMLVPAGLREGHAALRTEYLKNPTARPMGAGLELHGVHKDGRQFPVEITVSPIRTREGMVISSIIRDITDRKRMEQTSRQAAVLSERNRLARDVHDNLTQGLTSIVLQLEGCEDVLTQNPREAQKHIVRARSVARSSLEEARRSLVTMHAPILHETNLPDAVEQVISDLRKESSALIGLSVRGSPRPLSLEMQEHLLRISQEALRNAIWHSNAKEVRVELTYGPDAVGIRIEDNGRGFSVRKVRGGRGLGLAIMQERASEIGAQFNLRSRREKGTRVEVWVPVPIGTPEGSTQ